MDSKSEKCDEPSDMMKFFMFLGQAKVKLVLIIFFKKYFNFEYY